MKGRIHAALVAFAAVVLTAVSLAQPPQFKIENPQSGYPIRAIGRAIAVDGDTMVAGADGDDDGKNNSGSAYGLTRSGLTWNQQAKLTAADAAEYEEFGIAIALSGDTAVVGAYGDDDGGSASGSAYVFTRNGSIWTQQAKLTAADAAAYDYFGSSVAVDAGRAICGAIGKDDPETDSGAAYVFSLSDLSAVESWMLYR